MEERRFNRMATWLGREYIAERGRRDRRLGNAKHSGLLKCKLVHGLGYSIIIPDQLYLIQPSGSISWIQPLSFLANWIADAGSVKTGHLLVDISCRQTVLVVFRNDEFIRRFNDGSELFRCVLFGPPDLETYVTGTSSLPSDNEPRLPLFHFTKPETAAVIESCGYYLPSPWNIQGTKRLTNVGYANFTSLDSIRHESDLRQIAMASDKVLTLVTDRIDPPAQPNAKWAADNPSDVLRLTVYQGNMSDRTARMATTIPASLLSPQHLHKHRPRGSAVYYNICNPFIHRVGVEPGERLPFDSGQVSPSAAVKRFDYIVMGTATTLEGLAAPYDEEDTRERVSVERVVEGTTMLDFWFRNANRDLVTGRPVELQQFES